MSSDAYHMTAPSKTEPVPHYQFLEQYQMQVFQQMILII